MCTHRKSRKAPGQIDDAFSAELAVSRRETVVIRLKLNRIVGSYASQRKNVSRGVVTDAFYVSLLNHDAEWLWATLAVMFCKADCLRSSFSSHRIRMMFGHSCESDVRCDCAACECQNNYDPM